MPHSTLVCALQTSLNVHRVIITSLMVAAKFFDDFYFNNAFYARVGGISVLEVSQGGTNPALGTRHLSLFFLLRASASNRTL